MKRCIPGASKLSQLVSAFCFFYERIDSHLTHVDTGDAVLDILVRGL